MDSTTAQFARIPLVAAGASLLGWDQDDVFRFMHGMTLSVLIREDIDDPYERPPASDPRWKDPAHYWWCFRPTHSFSFGWWSPEKIAGLRSKLVAQRADFEELDFGKLEKTLSVYPPRDLPVREKFFLFCDQVIETYDKVLAKDESLVQILVAV